MLEDERSAGADGAGTGAVGGGRRAATSAGDPSRGGGGRPAGTATSGRSGTAAPDAESGTAAPDAEELIRARMLMLRPAPGGVRSRVTAPTLVALLLLALSAGTSLTFVLTRGALTLPTHAPDEPAAGAGSSSPMAQAPSPGSTPSVAGSASATSGRPTGSPVATRGDRHYAETDPAIVYSGTWGRATGSGYSGGAVAWTTQAGARAMLTFNARRVAWYGPVGPTRGSAVVYLDGTAIATVSTYAASYAARRLLLSRDLDASGSHTIMIEAVGTGGHPMVAIDEIIAGS